MLASAHKWTCIYTIEDFSRKVILLYIGDDLLHPTVWTRENGAKKGLYLMPSLFDRLYIALGGTTLVTWTWKKVKKNIDSLHWPGARVRNSPRNVHAGWN